MSCRFPVAIRRAVPFPARPLFEIREFAVTAPEVLHV